MARRDANAANENWWCLSWLCSVLPPPPRYPSAVGYTSATMPAHTTMIETNNVLSTPTGPEYQFLVGEGMLLFLLVKERGQS